MTKKIIKIFLIFAFTVGIYNVISNAAISSSSKTVNSGEQVSISITSTVAVRSYSVSVTNNGGLTFVGSSGGTGAGTTTITDAKASGMTSLATFTFKAPSVAEDTKYTVSFSASAMDDINFNPVANSSCSSVITVKGTSSGSTNNNTSNSNNTPVGSNTNTKSNVADLSNLGIKPNDFKGFSPSKLSYSVTVPNEVESIEVYGTKKDSKASITGTGKKTLKEGANSFSVVVTAEDGTTKKTYTINVTRQAKTDKKEEEKTEEENTKKTEEANEEETNEVKGLKKLQIAGINLSPSFNTGIYEYEAKLIGEKDKLDITIEATEEDYITEITGNENLLEGENLITILVSDKNGENVATYQVTVNKSLVDEEALAKEQKEQKEQEEAMQKQAQKRKIITICASVGGVLLLIAIIMIIRMKSHQNYDNEYLVPYSGLNEEEYTQEEPSDEYSDDYSSDDYADDSEEYSSRRRSKKGKRFK